nr:hypothetical protein [Bradyrhizobium sp. th.b2]
MYADDAVIYCECGGTKTLTGRAALRAYWVDRFKSSPAFARIARATYVVSISRETLNRSPAGPAGARWGSSARASGVGTHFHCLGHERPTIYQYDRSPWRERRV